MTIESAIRELARQVTDQEYSKPEATRDDDWWEAREEELAAALLGTIEDETAEWWRPPVHYDHTDPYGPTGPQHDRPEEVWGER